ncbi:g10681 [Coccomyxa viridis]|uniref:G10681 protein n=1 Tax=Coccomyxa viridis TaxID=1274662 RepID=A0ABP1GAI3_9CHLO
MFSLPGSSVDINKHQNWLGHAEPILGPSSNASAAASGRALTRISRRFETITGCWQSLHDIPEGTVPDPVEA